jgi:hypothetical protein
LGVEDQDLDRIADYFGLVFEYSTEHMSVLVALLDRLAAAAKTDQILVQDVIGLLSLRLFSKCHEGEKAADRFQQRARRKAWRILESGIVQ